MLDNSTKKVMDDEMKTIQEKRQICQRKMTKSYKGYKDPKG